MDRLWRNSTSNVVPCSSFPGSLFSCLVLSGFRANASCLMLSARSLWLSGFSFPRRRMRAVTPARAARLAGRIPLERDRVPSIAQAIAAGRIAVEVPWLLPVVNQPADVAGLLTEFHGRCVFHQSQRCSIQSVLDHRAIPVACQHFPRVCLIDDRGVSVTLSHYCPTAASLLDWYEGPRRDRRGS